MAKSEKAASKKAASKKAASKKAATKKASLPATKQIASPKEEEVRKAWNEGKTMTLHGVKYKQKVYSSLWQVWNKKGDDTPEGLGIGSRGQCIKYRAALKKLGTKCPPFKDAQGKLHTFTLVPRDQV